MIIITARKGDTVAFMMNYWTRNAADTAWSEALARYPDCDVRMVEGDAVLLTVAPRPALTASPRGGCII